jgi:hypothetical protein
MIVAVYCPTFQGKIFHNVSAFASASVFGLNGERVQHTLVGPLELVSIPKFKIQIIVVCLACDDGESHN